MTTTPVSAPAPAVEPWLRGTHSEVSAVRRAVLHALDQSIEDLQHWTEGLSADEIHDRVLGLPSVAFHLRHIARSTDRLLSFAEGRELTADQLAALKSEQTGAESLAALLDEVKASFANASSRIRSLADANFDALRPVGRKQLPASMGGALVHVADHTQRHVGQVVTTAKVLRAVRNE